MVRRCTCDIPLRTHKERNYTGRKENDAGTVEAAALKP